MSSEPDFGPVHVHFETQDGKDLMMGFAGHSLSTGWFVGYDHNDEWTIKIPRNRVYSIERPE